MKKAGIRCPLAIVVSMVLIMGCAGPPEAQKRDERPEQPNILFVFADDLSWEAVGYQDETAVETPNLDRLAERGTWFDKAYNMGAWTGAVCVPSRAMLNTGRFVWHARTDTVKQYEQQKKLWPQLMNEAGYETYFTGKWHVKADVNRVFDHVGHERPGMPDDADEGYFRPKKGEPDPWDPWDREYGGYWEGGTHWSKVVANDTRQFLQDARKRDNPFFMYISFNAPHDPRQSPERFVNRYSTRDVNIPENFLPKHPHAVEIGCPWHESVEPPHTPSQRDEELAPVPRTPYAVKVHRREYYALISYMDRQIGRIVDHLKKTGEAKNTYIIFTADHGLAIGHHGLFGKQNLYEHSTAAPFLIAGPEIPEGVNRTERIYIQDAMATALDLADQPIPDHVQFKSLLPLVRGDRDRQYPWIYGGYRQHQRSIIDGRYKLLLFPRVPKVLLFDLQEDPEEKHNLADREEYRDVVKRLYRTLIKNRDVTGDTMKLTPYFSENNLVEEF